ncbi:quercetin dioxygenase-like cupin family protein [Kribbella amoyensis]|uniref:Quercetin dioxygenase-like cupin family protein n=1 Tax=Kribbella amoyensis TaxID=996641 RepID=A0A561B8E3_9ACTN|nr:cupin domain-containing protein [Kribbella amoyensis]TWD75231.1 quercetin dioxygenase-like cupin family protein [Kribbella amoyensis]
MTFHAEPDRSLRMPTGEQLTILRRGAETGGAEFAVEAVLPPRLSGPPPHRHRTETETFHVLEGTLRVRLGSERLDLTAGQSIIVPPWTVHGFSNPTDEPTRIRTEETPASQLEEQFRVLADAGRFPPLRRLARINVEHDLSFHLHGIPDPVQRLLWRALAAIPLNSPKEKKK